jgi:hypothetical protein
MMSTYELVIAFLSTNSTISSSSTTTEVITIRTRKVLLNDVDSEISATNETDL